MIITVMNYKLQVDLHYQIFSTLFQFPIEFHAKRTIFCYVR